MKLILHATSSGPLRDTLDRYWNQVRSDAKTTSAQHWFPHCTVTKTLRDSSHAKADLSVKQVDLVCQDLEDAVSSTLRNYQQPQLSIPKERFGICEIDLACSPWIQIGKLFHKNISTSLKLECQVELRQHISVAWGVGFLPEYHEPLFQELFEGVSMESDHWKIGLWTEAQDRWASVVQFDWT